MCQKLGVKVPSHLIRAQFGDGLGPREAQKRRSRAFRHRRFLISEVPHAKIQSCRTHLNDCFGPQWVLGFDLQNLFIVCILVLEGGYLP